MAGFRKYQRLASPSSGHELYRPVVTTQITGPKGAVTVKAVVDPTVEVTVLPRSLGELIGVEMMTRQLQLGYRVGGIKQVVAGTVVLEMNIDDGIYRWSTAVGFAQFVSGKAEEVVLGYRGCLEYFTVIFAGESFELTVAPNNRFPGECVLDV